MFWVRWLTHDPGPTDRLCWSLYDDCSWSADALRAGCALQTADLQKVSGRDTATKPCISRAFPDKPGWVIASAYMSHAICWSAVQCYTCNRACVVMIVITAASRRELVFKIRIVVDVHDHKIGWSLHVEHESALPEVVLLVSPILQKWH